MTRVHDDNDVRQALVGNCQNNLTLIGEGQANVIVVIVVSGKGRSLCGRPL
jgi:hypothetical protein